VAQGTPDEIRETLVDQALLLWSEKPEALLDEASRYTLHATGTKPVKIQIEQSMEAQDFEKN
jgi:hypothetical protein